VSKRLVRGVTWVCVISLGLALGLTNHPTGVLRVLGLAVGLVNLVLIIGLLVLAVSWIRRVGVSAAFSASRTWVALAVVVVAGLVVADLVSRAFA
jgi:uncharacterized membrane protein required for colicin V production